MGGGVNRQAFETFDTDGILSFGGGAFELEETEIKSPTIGNPDRKVWGWKLTEWVRECSADWNCPDDFVDVDQGEFRTLSDGLRAVHSLFLRTELHSAFNLSEDARMENLIAEEVPPHNHNHKNKE